MVASAAKAQVLDFTNTKDGVEFNKRRVPAGDYLAKVTRVVDAPTKDGKEPQWLYTIALTEKFTDRKFPYYCKLVENQLWKVRNLFIAAGLAIPKKKVKLDPNRVVGKTIAVTLEDDEFEGKMQSTIAAIFSPNDLQDSDGVDDEEPEDDEETEDEVDEEEDAEAEDDAEEEPEEDEDDEEDEEEEPPARPAKKAAARIPAQRKASPTPARKAAAAKTRRAPKVEDEELEELDIDDL